MTHPWTKKNPFMSMWLSGANAMLGAARGQAHAAIARSRRKVAASNPMVDAYVDALQGWSRAFAPPAAKKPRRKRSR